MKNLAWKLVPGLSQFNFFQAKKGSGSKFQVAVFLEFFDKLFLL